jgi:hypothetical protein
VLWVCVDNVIRRYLTVMLGAKKELVKLYVGIFVDPELSIWVPNSIRLKKKVAKPPSEECNSSKEITKQTFLLTTMLVMSTIPKRKQKRSDIEANYRNETKTF